ncbi:MAG: alpha/beta hydrolase [Methyloceanibacter sp.]
MAKALRAVASMDHIVTTDRPAGSDLTSRTVRLADGRRIGYAEYGDPQGASVLAIHGTPGSRFMFALTDKAASERSLRIFAPERAGYGLSDFRRQDGLARAADDLRWFADAVGLRRFALIGVSGGGPYAVAAAAAMAERVALLALISPVGPIAECQSKIRMSKLHRLIFTKIGRSRPSGAAFFWSLRHIVRYAPDLAYRGLMQRVAPTDRSVLLRGEVKANLQTALREGLRPGIAGARQDLRLLCAPWGLKLEEIDAPSIVWQGSDDTIVPPGAAYQLAETLPNCRLDVIQGAGHYWMFGEFHRVLDAVQAALRG